MEEIQAWKIHPGAVVPKYESRLAAGFDLAACEDTTILAGETMLVRTGLILQYDPSLYLQLYNRSSTPKKWGLVLANGVGVVDPDYCGPGDEIRLLYRNTRNIPVLIMAGTRLAQGVLAPRVKAYFRERDGVPSNADRGGFGSTN